MINTSSTEWYYRYRTRRPRWYVPTPSEGLAAGSMITGALTVLSFAVSTWVWPL